MGARLRASAAVAAGAFCVHQLRYLAGHGEGAAAALAREGHAYMSLAGPLVAALCAVALAQLAVAVQRRAGPSSKAQLSRLWPLAAASLVAVYVVQESLEGVLVAGHPAGLAGVVGTGGWVALPLAVAVGLVVALLLRGADVLLAARSRVSESFARPRDALQPAPPAGPALTRVLARHLAGRAPPLPSS